jgi:transcriptional regulator with XRE-family HTH domain
VNALDYKVLGCNIKKARRTLNLTQEKLAEIIDMSTIFISHIESGLKCPSLETMYRISLAVNTPIDLLLENTVTIDNLPNTSELTALLHNRSKGEVDFITAIARELTARVKGSQFI